MSVQTKRTAIATSFLSTPWARAATGTLVLVGGIVASMSAMNAHADTKSLAQDGKPVASQGERSHDHARHHGHRGHGKHHAGGLLGGRHLDKMLDEVKATDAQRAQIKQINEAARADLRKLHEGSRDMRGQSLAILAQPQIDANAAEALRQQMLARHDAVTKRSLAAMLDVARVLTPEQRAQLADKMKARKAKFEQRRQERAQRAAERQ